MDETERIVREVVIKAANDWDASMKPVTWENAEIALLMSAENAAIRQPGDGEDRDPA